MKKEDICYVIATCRRAESSIFASFVGKCMNEKMTECIKLLKIALQIHTDSLNED